MSQYYENKYIHYRLNNSLTDKYICYTLFGMARYTFKDFKAEYPDDDACLDAVFSNRYGDLKYCPRCGAETKFYRVKKRKCYACAHCAYQLHPLANTIFRKSETSLWNWFYAIYLVSQAKNGISAKELERHLGVTYKTAWRMLQQIRKLMEQDDEKLSGTVEVDETYYGGKTVQKDSYRNKTPIVGVAEKRGKLKATVVDGASAYTVLPYIRANVDPSVIVHTDQSRIYARLKREYAHEVVDHGQYYAIDGIHTNNLEGFWSQLKRSIAGTYHWVSPKYLDKYVDEFVFRFNHRYEPVCPLLLARVGKLS